MSSSFSEKKGLWGLLSLTGSQNLPQVDLILYLPFFFPFALLWVVDKTTISFVKCSRAAIGQFAGRFILNDPLSFIVFCS